MIRVSIVDAYLVESVEELRDQGRARRRCTESLHQTEFLQVADEAIGCEVGESQRVSPEVPLEGDD